MAQFTNSPFANLNQVEIFQLTSSDIADGQPLSGRYLSGRMQIPGGQDVSPQLSWWGFPAETKSFAVTMYDPDAPTQGGWWHWAVCDIPAAVTELPTDAGNPEKNLLPEQALALNNDAGFPGYLGCAPPAGHGPHRYFFVVHAVDVESLGLPASATPNMLGFNLFFHSIGRATLQGTFELPAQ
ncbi:YbhB/YbcL family Raf kinase inhibitor-like protein [Granulicoccus phenolivorans]|uniref:YbhB/YbcL family Raf kinase inhibitor-like protein n=1 Tax=Granulicoccus phenolivorans TaxID=266854 RepID=UPI0004015CD2|nr:YbhB/YbcL family Raf kinase inhibitor-like protein [Granulicoccus phenolivorans]